VRLVIGKWSKGRGREEQEKILTQRSGETEEDEKSFVKESFLFFF